jgi:hypothetical protein
MKAIDFAKAFGLGALVLALNVGLLFAIGFVYSTVIDPGRTEAEYMSIYLRIGNWSAPIAGISLLFLAAWLSGRRRPERNAFIYALATWASYLAIDTASGLAMAPLSTLLVPPFLIGMSGGLVASLAGAGLAVRSRS